MAIEQPLDCPECNSAGSVTRDFCEVCYAEFGEISRPAGARLALENSHPEPGSEGRPVLHPSIRFRFTHVVEELQAISELASQAVEVEGSRLAAACRRAESLLRVLRLQFLEDIGVGERQRRAAP